MARSAEITPLIDSREQNPLPLEGAILLRGTGRFLAEGDYTCCESHARQVSIERKSLSDLFGSIGHGRERFMRELERLRPYSHKAIVIEGTLADVRDGTEHSTRMHPSSVVGSLAAIQWRYQIPVVFCGMNRSTTTDYVHRMLSIAHKDCISMADELTELLKQFTELPDPSKLLNREHACEAISTCARLLMESAQDTSSKPFHHYIDAIQRAMNRLKVP